MKKVLLLSQTRRQTDKQTQLNFIIDVLAIFEDFLTGKEKIGKIKKMGLVLEDVAKLFYFMTFIPKLHILATKGKKSWILMIFVHILAILKDFHTEMEKNE